MLNNFYVALALACIWMTVGCGSGGGQAEKQNGTAPASPAKAKVDVKKLSETLRTGTKEEKVEAAKALGEAAEAAAPACPDLIAAMKEGQTLFDPVEMAASNALQKIGRPAALALLEDMKKSKPTRMSIAETLEDLAPKVVPELTELSKSTDERLRLLAVEALGDAGKDGAQPLGEALRDIEESVKREAAQSLVKLGPDAAGAVKHLAAAVERRDTEIIGEVVSALGKIGPAAKEALPALESLAKGENMPENRQLSDGLKREIDKSIRKIKGEVRK